MYAVATTLNQRNLGYDPDGMSSTTSPTASQGATASSSYSDLFPTSSGSSSGDSARGGGGPNVYYLVFLGVLIALMAVAGCLALRALRMRRRYRTATQRAIERGEPLPPVPIHLRDDYWGLGGLSGWTADGFDRLGALRHDDRRGAGWRDKWGRVPGLYEAEVEKDSVNGDDWEGIRPLTLHSRRPTESSENAVERDEPETTEARNMGPRPRPPPLFHFRHRSPSPSPSSLIPGKADRKNLELNRPVQLGESVMMAVVIQMPSEKTRDRGTTDDGEEQVGWEPGMELGVWEGSIGPGVGNGAEAVDGYGRPRSDGGVSSGSHL